MNILSLCRQSFGGICCLPKLPAKSFLLFLLILIQFSFPSSFSAADTAAENPVVGTEVAPKASQPPELSTYRLEVGDSFVVTVDGYPEYSKERIPVPVQQDGYVSYPLIGLIKVTGAHGF